MLTLSAPIVASIDAGRVLVVPDGRRAEAVRLAYAASQAARGRTIWRTPNVIAWSSWLDREAAAASAEGVRLPRIMGEVESWLVWRGCAHDAARDVGITASDALIEGLRRAAVLAVEWLIPTDSIARGAHIECRWLALAMRAFDARCRDLAAAPLAELAARIDRARSAHVGLAGFSPLTPSQRARVERWSQAGSDVRQIASEGGPAEIWIARAADASDELAAASAWARSRLLEDPRRRLLIVVPNLSAVRPGVARAFASVLDSFVIEGGEPLAASPLARHALASLRFPNGTLDFDAVSAWLRSPYWQRPDAPARARLDIWLRSRLGVRVGWRELADALSAPPEALANAAAELRRRLDGFASSLPADRARSNVWVERFVAALTALGFPGKESDAAPREVHVRFREALNELATLDVMLGDLAHGEAVDWLERLLSRATVETAAFDPAVTITDALADPIVRYDGIWITDLRAESWPAPVRRDPFIPAHAQLAAGWPSASAGGQLAQARALLATWSRAADELILSWPSSADDCEQMPSALLPLTQPSPPQAGERVPKADEGSPAQALFASGKVEHFEDADGEPWRDAAPLPSGSRSVEHQIRCAFRAYAQLRLGAEPLERPRPGLDPRERGRLVHHALDLLWRELRDSGRLAAKRGAALNRLIERAVERAAAHLLAEEPGAERERALRRERRRAVRLLTSLCELEAKRTPFTVIERERRLALEIEGARLNVRVDRIDRLDDGRLALIDYKTGEPQKQDWLGDRPTHPQLLVYLRGVTGEVAALANAHLATGRVAFRGIADRAGRLPKLDALAPSDDASDAWRRQIASWREIVERAVRDFVAGRALRDPAEGACRFCHLHAFCRIGDAAAPGAHDE